jgi:hypothetical protein
MTARRYAEGTDVPVERSRAELERLLVSHGATGVGIWRDPTATRIVFQLSGRMIRHVVKVPEVTGQKTRKVTTPRQLESEHRRRWRALVLITKAKLELIASGDSDVEREFMADTLLPDGTTVYEAAAPRLAEAYATGGMPPFLLGPGSAAP